MAAACLSQEWSAGLGGVGLEGGLVGLCLYRGE